jgi:uncharacterized protein (DUF4415 family)
MKRVSSCRKSASDLKRLAALNDSDILVDADAPAWTPKVFARAVARRGLGAMPTETLLSVRADSDVVEWFGAQGRGYHRSGPANRPVPCCVLRGHAGGFRPDQASGALQAIGANRI